MDQYESMMLRIYIIDYIGLHAPDFSYSKRLKSILQSLPNTVVEILSNYPDNETKDAFLCNQYEGSLVKRSVALYRNYHRINRLVGEYPDALFIFLAFGNEIDINFLRITGAAANHIIDIQDALSEKDKDNYRFVSDLAKTYNQWVSRVVSHSPVTDSFLQDIDYPGTVYRLPSELDLTRDDKVKIENEDTGGKDTNLIDTNLIENFVLSLRRWLKPDNSEKLEPSNN